MKRSWMLSVWLCWLCVGLASAQPVTANETKATKAMARLLTRAASYEPHFIAAGNRYGLDPRLLWVVAYLETRFNPLAVSRKGARGMMQFMPATASRYGLRDPHESASAIDAAARYLRDLLRRYGQRVDLALAAYNAGETTVDAALQKNGSGIPPYRETQSYVRRGLQLLARKPATPAPMQASASTANEVPAANQQIENEKEAIKLERKRGLARQSVFVQTEAETVTGAPNLRLRRSLYFSKIAPQ